MMIRSTFTSTVLLSALLSISSLANAARLDGCSPSAPENQNIKGSVWKSKCLNASVNAVWDSSYNNMTLAEAKKTSRKNGAWKLFSQERFAKKK